MGGRVSLESKVGQGSTFMVVLRLEKDQSDEELLVQQGEHDHLDKSFAVEHPLSILAVEDDALNTRLICEILERLGYATEAVTDGYKALAVLTEDRHNVVLMDMQMSRLDGLETVRRIRAGECGDRAQGIVIIAMTALALPEERRRILAGGVDHYISKPLHLGSLKQILGEVSTQIAGK